MGFRLTFIFLILFGTSLADIKETVRITGSSSVYPIISFISESILDEDVLSKVKSPIIESVGTGAGFDAFCKTKFSNNSPDIVNASRQITQKEKESCTLNGIHQLEKITVGLDGIVLAFTSNKNSAFKDINLTITDIANALLKYIVKNGEVIENTNKTWKDVRSDLPDVKITVYGPPSTSGTYDFFVEKLQENCMSHTAIQNHFGKRAKESCKVMRFNEAYIAVADQDIIISRKIELSKNALGVVRFAFFENSSKKLSAVSINSKLPSEASITSLQYPIARPLFVYYNAEILEKVYGLREFLVQIMRFSYRDIDNNSFSSNESANKIILPLKNNVVECKLNNRIIGGNLRCSKS